MKAVILNSGLGSRMGELTRQEPKCFTRLADGRTILERQLDQLEACGVRDVLITTGPFPGMIQSRVEGKYPGLRFTFVENPRYDRTNYIYSLYLAREELDDHILLMHGDLVFDRTVLQAVLEEAESCMTCDSTLPLPEKDFKAVVRDGRIQKVGIEFFEDAVAAQPLYKLLHRDWSVWMEEIQAFCEAGEVKVYAENALNRVSDRCLIRPLDVAGRLCSEVDNPEDLEAVNARLKEEQSGGGQ